MPRESSQERPPSPVPGPRDPIFAAIFEEAPIGIVLVDVKGRFVRVNAAYEAMVGYTEAELRGTRFQALTHPDDLERNLEMGARLLDGAVAGYTIEKRYQRKDGATIWVRIRVSLVADDGEVPMFLAIVEDITERKTAADEVRSQKEVLQQIFDHSPVMISLAGADGRIELVNPAFERITGWSLEDVKRMGLDLYTQAYPDRDHYEAVRKFAVEARGEWRDFRSRVCGGRFIDATWIIVRLSDGKTIQIGTDMSERKRIEDEEREQRALAEAMRDTLAALNSTLDFDEVLQRILENVGHVVPHDASSIMVCEDDQWRAAGSRGYERHGAQRCISLDLPDDDYRGVLWVVPDTQVCASWVAPPGTEWIRSHITAPIRCKGDVIGVLNLDSAVPDLFTASHVGRLQAFLDQAAMALENARLLREVDTGRERLQALSNQMLVAQEVERRSVARELHDEIGQVLTAVGANLRAVQLSDDPATLVGRLDDSLALIDEALKQVRDLSLDLRPSLLDDFGLVPTLEWFVERQAQRSGFTAVLTAAPPEMRLPPNLETTCFRVAQVALTNAARHANATHVSVDLRLDDSELELTVRDDGVGFDVAAALRRASRGATLGILSMQERVRLARGHLDITSHPHRGTEVRARFPVDQVDRGLAAARAPHSAGDTS